MEDESRSSHFCWCSPHQTGTRPAGDDFCQRERSRRGWSRKYIQERCVHPVTKTRTGRWPRRSWMRGRRGNRYSLLPCAPPCPSPAPPSCRRCTARALFPARPVANARSEIFSILSCLSCHPDFVVSYRSNATAPVRHVPAAQPVAMCVSTACESPRSFTSHCVCHSVLLIFACARAPTLSYTKTLETRIADLEAQLAKAHGDRAGDVDKPSKPSPHGSSAEYSSSAGQTPEQDDATAPQELANDFDGLTIENDGRVSFHGPTSLFHLLPNDNVNDAASSRHQALELEARKERLINNAWRERAIEQLSGMPVSTTATHILSLVH